ncbi:hypothetical protein M5Y83_10225, partial [Neisseria meningitidis]|nr:hypothetical protein [Neisseria meningitidis]
FVSSFSTGFIFGKDVLSSLDMCDGFVAVCRFDQGAAVEGAGVGFLKNLVPNILFKIRGRSPEN